MLQACHSRVFSVPQFAPRCGDPPCPRSPSTRCARAQVALCIGAHMRGLRGPAYRGILVEREGQTAEARAARDTDAKVLDAAIDALLAD